MNWVIHDTYKTQKEAEATGQTIVKLGLSKGVKVRPNKKNRKRPFELYIRTVWEKL